MNDYKELKFSIEPYSDDASDLLAALLADVGFESFVAQDPVMTAYVPAEKYDASAVENIAASFPMDVRISYDAAHVEGRDWNEEWEKNYFQPIVVADRCVIHSTFHKDVPEAEYDIVIDPKMAFGTGHHSTTALMLGYLLDFDLQGKSVIDVGTGTGILAILCKMRGGDKVLGIEIDPAAYMNAEENVRLNGADVTLLCGDASSLPCDGSADLLIANINRNIILADIDAYAASLRTGGDMLLSGFYLEDVPMVTRRGAMLSLYPVETRSRDGWAALRLRKS